MNHEEEDSPYLVEIETIKNATHIRNVLTAIKIQLQEVSLHITEEKLEILQADPTHTVLVHLELFANEFHSYKCVMPSKIGLSLINIDKILKCVAVDDSLTIFVEDPNYSNYDHSMTNPVGFLIQKPENSEIRKIRIRPIETDEDPYKYPDLSFSSYEIDMNAHKFSDIINHLKTTGGEVVQIIYNKETLTMISKGESCESEVTILRSTDDQYKMNIRKNNQNSDEHISIFVTLQKLVEFTKCTALSENVTIYLNNNAPLVLSYRVGPLGTIKLGVASRPKPDDW